MTSQNGAVEGRRQAKSTPDTAAVPSMNVEWRPMIVFQNSSVSTETKTDKPTTPKTGIPQCQNAIAITKDKANKVWILFPCTVRPQCQKGAAVIENNIF